VYPYIHFVGITIPSYGFCMAISIMLCGFLYINKSRKLGLFFDDMIIIAAVSVGVGILSGGLLYIFVTYSPEELFNYIKSGNFLFITNVGLVFYGGLIGGILGAIISSKILKVQIELVEKCTVPYIPLGHSIGRIGCLMAGCCYGFEYNGIFAVTNSYIFSGRTYFPIQLVEALLNLMIMLFLLLYTKRNHSKYSVLYCYLIMYTVMRFCLECFRGDEIRGGFMMLSTSQWISILIFLFCIISKYLFAIKDKITFVSN